MSANEQWEYVLVAEANAEQLAKDVLSMAAAGGMPDTFWLSDQRINRACSVLGVQPADAREAARAGIYGQAKR